MVVTSDSFQRPELPCHAQFSFCTRSLQTVSIQNQKRCKRKGREKERCSQALHLELLDRACLTLATAASFRFSPISLCAHRTGFLHTHHAQRQCVHSSVLGLVKNIRLLDDGLVQPQNFLRFRRQFPSLVGFFPLLPRLFQRTLFPAMNFLWPWAVPGNF